jgi:hypothetical protein
MSQENSPFNLTKILVPTLAVVIPSAVAGGIYFGARSLQSIDNDPLHVKPDYKGVVKELDKLKKPVIETRQNTNEPESNQQLSKQFAQLQKEGLVASDNSKKVIDKKSGSVIFRNSFESKSSSLTKCLNDLRRKNKDANFETVLIQNTMGYDRVCTATGKVMETGKNIQAQEIMPYVKGEIKGLDKKYAELKGKQIQVNNYANGSIHYTRHPSVTNSQRAIEINQILQNTKPTTKSK